MAEVVSPQTWHDFLDQAADCPRCRWQGTIRDCDPVPDEIVVCPICAKPIEVHRTIRFREFL